MLRVGVARRDITPDGPVPLGGYFTLRGRVSRQVLDPVYVRAIALEQGELRVVLLIFDLVIITAELAAAIRERSAQSTEIVCIATHSHSAPGGFDESFVGRLALGPHRPGALEALVQAGVEAVKKALSDLGEARVGVHAAQLPAIAINRRDAAVAADDHLWAVRFARATGDVILCGFPAHPVVVAERELYALSADFPGRVVAKLEERVAFAAFINGALGGIGTFLTPGTTVVEALAQQADPLVAAALDVLDKPLESDRSLRFASRELELPTQTAARAAFDDQSLGAMLTWPFNRLANRLFRSVKDAPARMQAISWGSVALLGTPADLGLHVAREMRNMARAAGFEHAFVASQADGYIGYVHRRDDYRRRPESGTLLMAMYENVMGMFGHDAGEALLADAGQLLAELSSRSAD